MASSTTSSFLALCLAASLPCAQAATPKAASKISADALIADGARCKKHAERIAREGGTDLYCSGAGFWTPAENAPIAAFDVRVERAGKTFADLQAFSSDGLATLASAMEQTSYSKDIEPGPDGRHAIVPGIVETGLSLSITPIVDASGRVSARVEARSAELLAMARVASPLGTLEAPSLSSARFDQTWRFEPEEARKASFGEYSIMIRAHKPVMP